jgi:hypothetical protein
MSKLNIIQNLFKSLHLQLSASDSWSVVNQSQYVLLIECALLDGSKKEM